MGILGRISGAWELMITSWNSRLLSFWSLCVCHQQRQKTGIMNLSDALDDFPNQNNQAGGPIWPGQPANPTWPGQPANPTWPGQPANPTWPGQPANPTLPGQPANPTWPGQPNMPAWPGQPNQPAQPGQPGAPGWPGPVPQTGPYGVPEQPLKPLTVPFDMSLTNGAYNKMLLTINGEVKPNAKQFTINLYRGKDIALHLNTRFNEEGKKVIVRNSLIANQWGQEERQCPSFPFVQGKPFEMKILCTDTEFKVAVNKSHLLEFKHRVREINQIKSVAIYNDVTLKSVNVETVQ